MKIFKFILILILNFYPNYASDSGSDSEGEGIFDWDAGHHPREIREKLIEKLTILNQNCEHALENQHVEMIPYFGRHMKKILLCDNHIFVNEGYADFEPILFTSLGWIGLPFVNEPHQDLISDRRDPKKTEYYSLIIHIIQKSLKLNELIQYLPRNQPLKIRNIIDWKNENLLNTCELFSNYQSTYYYVHNKHINFVRQLCSKKPQNVQSITSFSVLNNMLQQFSCMFSEEQRQRIVISFDFDDTLFTHVKGTIRNYSRDSFIDPETYRTFDMIKEFKFKCLIVTARVPTIHEQTLYKINANGVSLDYPVANKILQMNGDEKSPCFLDGILYTSHGLKGHYIPQILDISPDGAIDRNKLPTHWIHVDDSIPQCKSVCEVMSRYCDTMVFYYTAPENQNTCATGEGNCIMETSENKTTHDIE